MQNPSNDIKNSSAVHWYQGLFLQPQHMQWMQRQIYSQFSRERELAWPFAYGVIESKCSFSPDSQGKNQVLFDRLRVVMPSGLEVSYPDGNADLKALNISDAFGPGVTSRRVYLAVPLYYDGRNNVSEGESTDRPYKTASFDLNDENTGNSPQPVKIRRVNARLVLEGTPLNDIEVLPLVRIVRSTEKSESFKLDETYVPPCLVLRGSDSLYRRVRDLVAKIESTRAEVFNDMKNVPFEFEKFQGEQIVELLRLRTLNHFSAPLAALVGSSASALDHRPTLVSPFELYRELCSLLGELAALFLDTDRSKPPPYDHDNLDGVFGDFNRNLGLDYAIREVLRPRTVVRPIVVNFTLNTLPPDATPKNPILVGRFEDVRLRQARETNRAIYLSIRPSGNAALTIDRLKNPDDIRLLPKKFIRQDLRGIRLVEQHDPVLGLPPPGSGLFYFRLDLVDKHSTLIWEQGKSEVDWAIGSKTGVTEMGTTTIYMLPNA